MNYYIIIKIKIINLIEIRSFKRPTIRKNLLNRVLGKVNKDKEVDIHDEAESNEVEQDVDELIVESSEVIESTSTIDPSLISSTSPPVVVSTATNFVEIVTPSLVKSVNNDDDDDGVDLDVTEVEEDINTVVQSSIQVRYGTEIFSNTLLIEA